MAAKPMVEPMALPAASGKSARSEKIAFKSARQEGNLVKFTLAPINVSYANTLRRIILTGIESIAFRSDMISTGSKAGTTTDVVVIKNDTPMTNEMLADRIGLLPINISNPLEWNFDNYEFILDVEGSTDKITYVTAGDFIIKETDGASVTTHDKSKTAEIFPPSSITGDTPLIAILQPSTPPQKIHIMAKASIGTGREHARFSTVSQCSYEYSLDPNPDRIEEMFTTWLAVAKKISSIDKASQEYLKLEREFNTMQIKRCYLMDEKQQPYSFDFTLESVGTLNIDYIVKRACEVAENMCSAFVHIDNGDLPENVIMSAANSQIVGFDFLVKRHDHTLGNLLQTWLVENHIEGGAQPQIRYAGYSVPHPLRDEMILRIGVDDGKSSTARKAFAVAAAGCGTMFRDLRVAWENKDRQSGGAKNILRRGLANAMNMIEKVTVTKI